MNRFLLSTLLFVSLRTIAQDNPVTNVIMNVIDSRDDTSYTLYRPKSVNFFKLPEDKLVKIVGGSDMGDTRIEVGTMPVATYRVRYKNVWKQDVDTQIVLTNKPENTIQLFIDKLISYPTNTLEKLKEKDSIVITDKVMGCFVHMTETIVIVKQKGKFIANYYIGNGEPLPGKKKGYVKQEKPIRTAVLTDENIWDFIKFENELNYLVEGGGCTTTETYDFTSKYWNVRKVDGTCFWNGFRYLRMKLFKEN